MIMENEYYNYGYEINTRGMNEGVLSQLYLSGTDGRWMANRYLSIVFRVARFPPHVSQYMRSSFKNG